MKKEMERYCNKCGKRIRRCGEIMQEDVLHVEKEWGYFSEKDGERHQFDLCEACYDKLLAEFILPVTIEQVKEIV